MQAGPSEEQIQPSDQSPVVLVSKDGKSRSRNLPTDPRHGGNWQPDGCTDNF
jgi:hypothetical protein